MRSMLRLPWFGLFLFSWSAAVAGERRPCPPSDPAYVEADRALVALDTAIEALAPDADPAPLIARAEALAGTRCFALLEDGLALQTKDALALKTYWEHGGHDHLRSYLDLGKPAAREVSLPPEVRKTMREVFPTGHPLAPLVCPPTPGSCGLETAGWELRLQEVLDRAPSSRKCRSKPRGSPSDPEQCGHFAATASPRARFRRFVECLAATQPTRPAAAMGRLRLPADGWLTISGRRGHYHFCDELRAFDLTTGASFRVATCSGLVLRAGGSVDNRATDRARQAEIEMGQVPVAAIRETAWVLLLQGALEEVKAEGVSAALPREIAPVMGAGPFTMEGVCGGGILSCDQTFLSWQVQQRGQLLAAGKITWPSDYNDAVEAHATSLLRIAEASFVPGCPPAQPPRGLFDEGLTLGANKLDTDAASLRTADDALTGAWRRAVTQAESCRAKPR